jgi:hypothetical protein
MPSCDRPGLRSSESSSTRPKMKSQLYHLILLAKIGTLPVSASRPVHCGDVVIVSSLNICSFTDRNRVGPVDTQIVLITSQ